jgi:hypothetical protein
MKIKSRLLRINLPTIIFLISAQEYFSRLQLNKLIAFTQKYGQSLTLTETVCIFYSVV